MHARALVKTSWTDPVAVANAHAATPFCLALLSGGEGPAARWSYLALDPDAHLILAPDDGRDPFTALADLLGPPLPRLADGPPFQGGVAGLCGYGLGARAEGLRLAAADYPDAVFARYGAVLAFDHQTREVIAVGRDQQEAERALSWLAAPAGVIAKGPLSLDFSSRDGESHERAVADVVGRIGAGEIFQANIARVWRGNLAENAQPFDLAARLYSQSPAPFAAYFRFENRALVSNSPERFLQVEGRRIESRPIKGTAPRSPDPAEDARLAQALLASAKDRAENLMIVDLMRNDLSRVCLPGEVETPELFRIETFANVHHLVSTVRGTLVEGAGPADVLRAAFPPGSITGAPKVQAMKVIDALEPARGPFFGSIFWAGFDGAMDANVLIRTTAFTRTPDGWTLEARAGGGIVADSDPVAERAETEAKIDAVRSALLGDLNDS